MANTLRFKRGLVSTIPTAALGEPLFTTDTFDLYIGNGTTNTRFQKYIASGTTSQLLRGDGSLLTMPIVLTSPSTGQVLKYNGTSWVNDSDAGITGSGTTNYLPKFTGATTLGNSIIFDNGTSVGISSASPSAGIKLQVDGSVFVNRSGNVNYVLNSASSHYGFIQNDAGNKWSLSSGTSLTTGLGTAALTWFSTGNVSIGNLSDNGLRFQVTGDGFFSGSVGIGTTTLTAISLRVSKNLTGAVSSIGIVQEGQVQTDVTSAATGFRNLLNTAASTTLGDYYHIRLGQGTIGAGTTLTQQIGLYINDFANGTNRYGILSELSAGTGKWNLYMGGTAANYLAGNLGVGTTSISARLHVSSTSSGDGIRVSNTGTATIRLFNNSQTTGSFELGQGFASGTDNVAYVWNGSNASMVFGTNATERMRLDASGNLGLGVTPSAWTSTRAIQVGLSGSIANRSGGNGFYMSSNLYFSADPSNTAANGVYINSDFATTYLQANGAHRWYNAPSGTAGNAITFTQAMTLFATGNLAVGTTTDAGYKLDVNGTMRVSGASTLSGGVTLGHTGGVAITFPGGQAFRSNGGIFIDYGNGGSGDLVFRRGAGVTNTLTLAVADGAATFSSSVTAASFIPTDTTAPTNGLYLAASNTLGFATASGEKMRLNASGNLGLGTTSPTDSASFGRALDVSGTNGAALYLRYSTDPTIQYGYVGYDRTGLGLVLATNNALPINFSTNSVLRLTIASTGAATFSSSVTAASLTATSNNASVINARSGNAGGYAYYSIGRTSEEGVFGVAGATNQFFIGAVAGDVFIGANNNKLHFGTNASTAAPYLTLNNGAATFSSNVGIGGVTSPAFRLVIKSDADYAAMQFQSSTNVVTGYFGVANVSGNIFTTSSANDLCLRSESNNILFGQGNAEKMRFVGSTGNLGIAMTPSYKLDVTGEARVSNAIAIGTTPDTNKPFKILKNINGTVGINFENTSTGSLAFSAIQMGTDVTGGTKFTNLVYASSGVTASGVYQPDGTSLINNGSGGLNFLGNPIRMYTGGSNGTLRWDMTNDGFITQYSGTNPSTNATDGYRQYSADVVAGNAAPHFRTENGAVIKLYQETTAVGNSIISLGGGNAVLDDTTFDGYTLRQIVKALRNQGILA